jgi:hypothetical protein
MKFKNKKEKKTASPPSIKSCKPTVTNLWVTNFSKNIVK